MSISGGIYAWFFKKRLEQIEMVKSEPFACQNKVFKRLVTDAKNTSFGVDHGFSKINSTEHFAWKDVGFSSAEGTAKTGLGKIIATESGFLVVWLEDGTGDGKAQSLYARELDKTGQYVGD
ncbi:MAG: GH3 family domain-containing protein, partial [Bacteroidia bacterium]